MDTVYLVVAALAGLLAGVVTALKVIAPMTKTTKDDALLAPLETAEDVVIKVRDIMKK